MSVVRRNIHTLSKQLPSLFSFLESGLFSEVYYAISSDVSLGRITEGMLTYEIDPLLVTQSSFVYHRNTLDKSINPPIESCLPQLLSFKLPRPFYIYILF